MSIKEHYIAYMDVLGYKAFFKEHPDEVLAFHDRIDEAINSTVKQLGLVNDSKILSQIGSVKINYRIFSDNILICLETTKADNEILRFLAFLNVVSMIQRGFISECGLFLRGGILRGDISIENEYVFGEGLIEAVNLESRVSVYPRIVVERKLVLGFNDLIDPVVKRVTDIEKALNNEEKTDDNDLAFYKKNQFASVIKYILNRLVIEWPDQQLFLNYMEDLDVSYVFGSEIVGSLQQQIRLISDQDTDLVMSDLRNFDWYLERHKHLIESELKANGRNDDIDMADMRKACEIAETREYVLRKFLWVMAYHNYICDCKKKAEYKILTKCGFDQRFLRMTIQVLDENERG